MKGFILIYISLPKIIWLMRSMNCLKTASSRCAIILHPSVFNMHMVCDTWCLSITEPSELYRLARELPEYNWNWFVVPLWSISWHMADTSIANPSSGLSTQFTCVLNNNFFFILYLTFLTSSYAVNKLIHLNICYDSVLKRNVKFLKHNICMCRIY